MLLHSGRRTDLYDGKMPSPLESCELDFEALSASALHLVRGEAPGAAVQWDGP